MAEQMTRLVPVTRVERAAKLAAGYAHSCQTGDGGYFFARITPGSLRDTYFAVETLRLLGQAPLSPDALGQFLESSASIGPHDAHRIYLFSATLAALGRDPGPWLSHGDATAWLVEAARRPQGPGDLPVEVVSALEPVFEAIFALNLLHIPFDDRPVVDFIRSLHNQDGGFGRDGGSSLPTTFYAMRILRLLARPFPETRRVLSFARRQEHIYFLEDIYYLSNICRDLGAYSYQREETVSFVLRCQRNSGGLARGARGIGIATLEYTFYGIWLLKQTEAL